MYMKTPSIVLWQEVVTSSDDACASPFRAAARFLDDFDDVTDAFDR